MKGHFYLLLMVNIGIMKIIEVKEDIIEVHKNS